MSEIGLHLVNVDSMLPISLNSIKVKPLTDGKVYSKISPSPFDCSECIGNSFLYPADVCVELLVLLIMQLCS
jgi:hypothetical protein